MKKFILMFMICAITLTGCGKSTSRESVSVSLNKEISDVSSDADTQSTESSATATTNTTTVTDNETIGGNQVSIMTGSGSDTVASETTTIEENNDSASTQTNTVSEEDSLLLQYKQNISELKYPKSFIISQTIGGDSSVYYEYKDSTSEIYYQIIGTSDEPTQLYISNSKSCIQTSDAEIDSVYVNTSSGFSTVKSIFEFRMSRIESVTKKGVLYEIAGDYYIGNNLHTGTVTVGDGYYVQGFQYDEDGSTYQFKVKTLLKMSKDSSSFNNKKNISDDDFINLVEQICNGSAVNVSSLTDINKTVDDESESYDSDTENDTTSEYTEDMDDSNKASSNKLIIGCSSASDMVNIVSAITKYGKYSISSGSQSEAMSAENLVVYHCVFSNISEQDMQTVIANLTSQGFDAREE